MGFEAGFQVKKRASLQQDDQVITATPQALSVRFDETITVSDLGSYDAGDGDYLFYLPYNGSGIKLIMIDNFSAGDAIQVQKKQ